MKSYLEGGNPGVAATKGPPRMRNIRVACHFASLILLTTSIARATDAVSDVKPGEIAGVVTDDKGNPLEGATVDAWSWYKGNETKTDKDGRFHLKKLDPHEKPDLRISK